MLLPPINITHVIAYVQYGVCSCQKADILPVVSSIRYFYVRLMLLPLIDVADVIAYVHYARCHCHVVDVMPLD